MNNSLLKYILIVAVCIIWGAIIYKIVIGTGDSVDPITSVKETTAPVEYIEKQDFYLFADYPDPFLEEEEVTDTLGIRLTSTSLPSAASLSPVPVNPDFTYIQYHGIITNSDKRNTIALVSFRGQELLIKEKDKKDDILFKKIGKDQLIILYKGQSFRIPKQ